jgi:hypothetical protein
MGFRTVINKGEEAGAATMTVFFCSAILLLLGSRDSSAKIKFEFSDLNFRI